MSNTEKKCRVLGEIALAAEEIYHVIMLIESVI